MTRSASFDTRGGGANPSRLYSGSLSRSQIDGVPFPRSRLRPSPQSSPKSSSIPLNPTSSYGVSRASVTSSHPRATSTIDATRLQSRPLSSARSHMHLPTPSSSLSAALPVSRPMAATSSLPALPSLPHLTPLRRSGSLASFSRSPTIDPFAGSEGFEQLPSPSVLRIAQLAHSNGHIARVPPKPSPSSATRIEEHQSIPITLTQCSPERVPLRQSRIVRKDYKDSVFDLFPA